MFRNGVRQLVADGLEEVLDTSDPGTATAKDEIVALQAMTTAQGIIDLVNKSPVEMKFKEQM